MSAGYQATVWKNALVKFTSASADISDHVTEVTLSRNFDMVEDTRMGLTARSYTPGLETWRFEMNLIQDFVSSGGDIDSLLYTLSQATTPFTIAVRPNNAARSCSNPEYSGPCYIESYTPLRGRVGELLQTPVPFRSAGNLSRVTTAS